jgi:hypothetical protein
MVGIIGFTAAVFGNVGVASATALAISVSTTPSNYPAFSSTISDYVIRGCPAAGGVPVSVTADPGDAVSVDNQAPQTGTFTATANVTTGQEFTVVETSGTTTVGTWYMRCLPSDFPDFTSSVTGTPQAQFYLTGITKPGATEGYVAFFDANGVPIWWRSTAPTVAFANVTSGYVAWTTAAVANNDEYLGEPVPVVNLNGKQVGTITSPDGAPDIHELQSLGGGDMLVIVDEDKCCVNLSSWGSGFPSNATIVDPVIEELSPQGTVLWSWDTAAHLNPVKETAPQWYSLLQTTGSPYDVYHMNSVSYQKGSLLVSFRHLDAIFGISMSTGGIFMKIGGSKDAASYTVQNDPVFTAGGTLCGQHDARIVSATTITVHDNGTGCGRAPRAVEYSLNTTAKTATLVTSLTDPRAPSSPCCGSARLLSGGDWVIDWGGNPLFTELTASGTPVYTVNWTDPGAFAYRVTPIMPGTYTAAQLRAGMNAQYPNTAASTRAATK